MVLCSCTRAATALRSARSRANSASSIGFAHFYRAGSGVVRDGSHADQDLHFGDHTGGRLDTGHRERCRVGRVSMYAGDGFGLSLHHLQMHQNFTGAFLGSGFLIAVHIHETHIRGFQEAFGHHGRGAEDQIFGHTDGNIATVAVHVVALPDTASNVADIFLELVDLRRIEERLNVGHLAFTGWNFGSGKSRRGHRTRGRALGFDIPGIEHISGRGSIDRVHRQG